MRFIFGIVFMALIFTASPVGVNTAHAKGASSSPGSFADLAERLLPTVVNISSTQKISPPGQDFPEMPHFPPGSPFEDFFEDFMERRGRNEPAMPPASLGSGFVIDSEKGYIITNNHVVKDADEVRVTFADDSTVEADVLGRDEKTDLAVLQVNTEDLETELVAADFGDSDVMRVGDWIVAIGNPFGLGGTVTAGIISARQRDINAGPYDDFIQTDASINRGNSGGPMFNIDGEVIGINTAIFSPSGGSVGIGFAIPSNLAKPVIRQLIEYGHTRRGWMGVRIQSVTDEIAESLGLDKARGALIASVTDEGPAAAAGLQPGDIVLKFNGHDIQEMRELPRIVAETKIGVETDVVYWRDGKEKKAKVTVGELEKAEKDGLVTASGKSGDNGRASITIDAVGFTVSDIMETDRETYSIDEDLTGVLVIETDPNGEAAEKGISPGEVVVEVNQQPVETPEQIKNLFESAEKQGRKSVLLLINSDGDVRFVALRIR